MPLCELLSSLCAGLHHHYLSRCAADEGDKYQRALQETLWPEQVLHQHVSKTPCTPLPLQHWQVLHTCTKSIICPAPIETSSPFCVPQAFLSPSVGPRSAPCYGAGSNEVTASMVPRLLGSSPPVLYEGCTNKIKPLQTVEC